MKRSLPLLLLVGLLAAPFAQAQVPMAQVTAVKGDVRAMVKSANAERTVAVEASDWLWTGSQVICPPDSSLTLTYHNGEVETHEGNKRITVREVALPASAKNVSGLLQIAARSQAGNALLVAPESAAFRPAKGLPIRWQAPPDVREVVVTVRVAGGPVVWTQPLPAAPGVVVSEELNRKLLEKIAEGKDTFRIFCTRPGTPAMGLSSVVVALPKEKEKDLEAQLAACGAPTAPWHAFLRAATFRQFELFEEALHEMETVLTKPEFARDPYVVTAAANLFEMVGQSPRAEALRTQLSSRLR